MKRTKLIIALALLLAAQTAARADSRTVEFVAPTMSTSLPRTTSVPTPAVIMSPVLSQWMTAPCSPPSLSQSF